jgi:hypothetical protein
MENNNDCAGCFDWCSEPEAAAIAREEREIARLNAAWLVIAAEIQESVTKSYAQIFSGV